MDSLLANYASSDEEEERQQPPIAAATSKTTSSISSSSGGTSSSSSSLFQSLPQPKKSPISSIDDDDEGTPAPFSSKFGEGASIFSSLPKPKSQTQPQQQQLPQPPPKKVVQFKPPTIPIPNRTEPDEDDEDDEEEEERNRKRKMESSMQAPSVKSFLSSIPAPRNSATLGVQSSSGSGRRSIIDTESAPEPAPEPSPPSISGGGSEGGVPVEQNAGGYVNYENYGGYQYGSDHNAGTEYYVDGGGSYGGYGPGYDQSEGFQQEAGVAGTAGYGNADAAYAGYSGYGDYGQYANNWDDGSSAAMAVPEPPSGAGESSVMFPKKRGRNEIPSEIIEVKQDELIKNRPREDQVKLTGIAFGPSYQPVSTKGKPSKLHKRKHQIGSLYFDMKQNEMKLAERRAKGMLTKSETQAKYGW